MSQLPELRAKSAHWRLPLLERDAVRLLEAILATSTDDRAAHFDRLLRQSPSFLLWTICAGRKWRRSEPSDTQEIASWLAVRGSSILRWRKDPSEDPYSAARQTHWETLARQSVNVAMQASASARSLLEADSASSNGSKSVSAKPVDAEMAYLHGLVHAAPEWFSSCGPRIALSQAANPVSPFPAWLIDLLRDIHRTAPRRESARLVAKAIVELTSSPKPSEEPAPDSNQGDPEEGSRIADLTPDIIAKLTRLERLEKDFQATLQTEKLEALRELAYGASHEINNPLANISTRAQTLLRDEQDPERRRKLATINSQAFRAHEMIADMMLFAKPPDLALEVFNLNDVIDEVVAELASSASDQGTQLLWTPVSPPPKIGADPVQMAVALRSLCVNALEAVGADGVIEIQVQPTHSTDGAQEAWMEIVVHDNGPGIEPEHRRHMFDPFYSGREAGRGLGLGLSKCWRIVSLHNGHIDVESDPAKGTTFRIRLPHDDDAIRQANGA